MVSSLDPTIPVIADADTGYASFSIVSVDRAEVTLFSFGGPANVARTVQQYIQAGIAGMHIEDQVQTKRCGHLMGKQVVSREEFLTRIRAAVIARDAIPGSDFVCRCLSPPTTYTQGQMLTIYLGHHWKNRLGTGTRNGRSCYSSQARRRCRSRCVLH